MLKQCMAFLVYTSVVWVGLAESGRTEQPQKLSAELALIPSDAQVLLSLQVDEQLRSGPEAASLKKLSKSHPVVPLWWLQDLEENTGLRPAEVDRVVIFRTRANAWIVAVANAKPFGRKNVLEALVPNAEEKTVNDKDYFHSEESSHSIFMVNDRLKLIGVGHDMKAFLRPAEPATGNPALSRAIAAANQGALLVVHMDATAIENAKELLGDSPLAKLNDATAWQIFVETKQSLRVRLMADFKTKSEAADGEAALKEIGKLIRTYLAMATKEMPTFMKQQEADYPGAGELATQFDTTLRATDTAFEQMGVRSLGTRAGAVVDIKVDDPVTTAAALMTLMPRPAR